MQKVDGNANLIAPVREGALGTAHEMLASAADIAPDAAVARLIALLK